MYLSTKFHGHQSFGSGKDFMLIMQPGLLALKAPNKNCSRQYFNFFTFIISSLIFSTEQ